MIFKNAKGQKAGFYNQQTHVFHRSVKKSKHLHRKMDAWGIDAGIVTELVRVGCRHIIILDTEENKAYTVSMNKFINTAVSRDFGHGEQLFLMLRYWE